jgi:putative DNA primase/helicase
MNNSIDFSGIAQAALSSARSLVEQWLPGGKFQGTEYVVKNPFRPDEHAGSFKINIQTGRWSDFATGDKGGDFISLYGFINGIRNKEAALQLQAILHSRSYFNG